MWAKPKVYDSSHSGGRSTYPRSTSPKMSKVLQRLRSTETLNSGSSIFLLARPNLHTRSLNHWKTIITTDWSGSARNNKFQCWISNYIIEKFFLNMKKIWVQSVKKRPKWKLSAHKWGGVFLSVSPSYVVRRRGDIFFAGYLFQDRRSRPNGRLRRKNVYFL